MFEAPMSDDLSRLETMHVEDGYFIMSKTNKTEHKCSFETLHLEPYLIRQSLK